MLPRDSSRMIRPDEKTARDDVEAVLQQTRAEFVSGFGAACTAMSRLIDASSSDTSGASRRELEYLVHRMSGLAGTIGFPTVSLRARELEDLVRDTPDQFDVSRAHRLLDAVQLGFEQDTPA